jgi:hypothetical protein
VSSHRLEEKERKEKRKKKKSGAKRKEGGVCVFKKDKKERCGGQ